MKKIAIILNWVMLSIFDVAFIVMTVRFGAGGVGGLLLMAPYATALLVFKSAPNRALIGASKFFNAFVLAFLAFGLFMLMTGRVAEPVAVLVVVLLLVPPLLLNSLLLKWAWDRARASGANNSLKSDAAKPRTLG